LTNIPGFVQNNILTILTLASMYYFGDQYEHLRYLRGVSGVFIGLYLMERLYDFPWQSIEWLSVAFVTGIILW